MPSYNFPDPSYQHDFANDYVSSPRVRLGLRVWELGRFLLSEVAVAIVLLLLVVAGLAAWWNSLFLILVASIGMCAWFAASLGWLRKVPLRCSRCRRHLVRKVVDVPSQKGVVFYVCPACRVYLDAGIAEED